MADHRSSTGSSRVFPNQRLTRNEKIKDHGSVEEWGQDVLKTIMGFSGHGEHAHHHDMYRMKLNYELAAGKFNMSSIDYVMNPYGMGDYTFPAEPKHYDVITPKLNTLRGEEINRPFNFRVVSSNPNSHTELEKEKKQMVHDSVMAKLQKKLQAQGIDINSPESQVKSQEAIEKEISLEYSEMREKLGQHALNYLRKQQEIEDKFHDGWFDLLAVAMEVYWTGVINNEPIIRTVNPLYFDYDRNEDIKYIEDSAWAIEWRYMAAPEVHDEFHGQLSDKDVKRIEEMKGGNQDTLQHQAGRIPFTYGGNKDTGAGSNVFTTNSTTILKVVHAEWKSLRKMGFLTFKSDDGTFKEKLVEEDFKIDETKEESIEWVWLNEVWEATLIGDDIMVNVRPKPNQHKSLDNPSACKLGYTGVVHNRRNSASHSLVDTLKPHQVLYDIVMYRLELALARAKGKGLIFDVAQIPRSKGINMERWLYYLDIFGIGFINSFEEGTGKFAGQTSKFNQFKEFDLTLSNTINQYILILDKLENMISAISGITPPREGQVSARDLASTTQTAIAQSANITEALFYSHQQAKKHALRNLLEEAKLAWINGKKGQYVMPDLARVFFTIEPELFVDEEYDVFVSNSAKDAKTLEMIDRLAEVAIQQNQIELQDLVTIFQSESIAESRDIFEKSKATKRANDQEIAEQDHRRNLQIQEAVAVDKDKERVLKDGMNIRDNETKLEVADMVRETQSEGNEVKREKNNLDARSNAIQQRVEEAKASAMRDKARDNFQPTTVAA